MKRILLLFFSWVTCVYAPPCFQPADGMNLWRMTAEMGSCLDIVLCSVGTVVPIMQTDLAASYVISAPNYYKICENITSAHTITISSNNVVLDLGSFFLNGVSIIVSNGIKNVTIKNGTIQNVAQGITIGSSTQNILVQNITLDTAVTGGTVYGIRATGAMNGLTLSNISFYDAAPQNIVLAGSNGNLITNVFFENIQCLSTNQALSATTGSDATIHLAFCENVNMNNITVADPFAAIDCIFLDTCNSVDLNTVSISSSLSNVASVNGVRLSDSNDIQHENVGVSGSAFTNGFKIGKNNLSQVINIFYTQCSADTITETGFFAANAENVKYQDCSATLCLGGSGMSGSFMSVVFYVDCTTGVNLTGLLLNQVNNVSVSGHTAIGNLNHGIFIATSSFVSVQDCELSRNGIAGLHIEDPFMLSTIDFVIENIICVRNQAEGMSFSSINDVIITDSSLQSNRAEGIFCDFVDNVIISGCDAQGNTDSGFRVEGVNEGHTPGDPEGDVGRSPLLIEGCSAILNGSHGFYTLRVGGALIRDCFASYNGGRGFWFDTGSWNAQIESSTALSNTSVGFITWDNAVLGVSTESNRFRDCYGGNNGTGSAFDPLGGMDFSMDNSPGLTTLTPIAAIYPSAVLGTPEAALAGAVSPIFCIFE